MCLKKKIVCLLALLVGLFAGSIWQKEVSAGGQQYVPEAQEEQIESDENYLVTYHDVEGIAFYDVVRQDNLNKNPLILFFPGFNSSKESVYSHAQLLANVGYTVVVPDLVGQHGSARPEVMHMFDIIYQTSAICDDLLMYYKDSSIVNTEQFALVGMSMGGMVALHFASYSEIRPVCVATMYSTPDFSSILGGDTGYIKIVNGEVSENDHEELKRNYIASMIQYSPDQNMEYLLQVPILLINGDIDPLIPVSAIKEFVVKKDFYANELLSIIREECGHETCAQDPADVIRFVYQHMPTETDSELLTFILGEIQ